MYDRCMTQALTVTLYSRRGCHLCESAEAILLRLGIRPIVVDVDGDARLKARYSELVPVVSVDGQDILTGIISEEEARHALADMRGGPNT